MHVTSAISTSRTRLCEGSHASLHRRTLTDALGKALNLALAGGSLALQALDSWVGGLPYPVPAEPPLALSGIAPRLLFGSILVSIQFALYTQLKLALGVAPADLTSYFQPLEPLLR